LSRRQHSIDNGLENRVGGIGTVCFIQLLPCDVVVVQERRQSVRVRQQPRTQGLEQLQRVGLRRQRQRVDALDGTASTLTAHVRESSAAARPHAHSTHPEGEHTHGTGRASADSSRPRCRESAAVPPAGASMACTPYGWALTRTSVRSTSSSVASAASTLIKSRDPKGSSPLPRPTPSLAWLGS